MIYTSKNISPKEIREKNVIVIFLSCRYNPNSDKVGTLCKVQTRIDCNDLQITKTHVLIIKTQSEHINCLN